MIESKFSCYCDCVANRQNGPLLIRVDDSMIEGDVFLEPILTV